MNGTRIEEVTAALSYGYERPSDESRLVRSARRHYHTQYARQHFIPASLFVAIGTVLSSLPATLAIIGYVIVIAMTPRHVAVAISLYIEEL